ncbi:YkoP family protein [Desmospora profundinema]|uniref:YkoP-like domain-containing protein n=1 Tax=Desmospora profundinema TaxID=1571184 RepID=A0ABU1IJL2_9BACL|nr:hypothetical protein [Desmospora profundinema]MDR6224951.1 hypothetical protein [Desmospora profundinema]
MVTDGLMQLWRVLDWFYSHTSRLQYVDKEHHNLFRVVFKRYRGDPLTTQDGVRLLPGDRYAKLHLHNWRLAHLMRKEHMAQKTGRHPASAVRIELKVMNEIRRSLPTLASFIQHHAEAEDIQVLAGTTFIYRGANHLHFDIEDYTHPVKSRFKSLFLKLILLVCQPSEWKRLWKRRDLVPKRVFISRNQLSRYYGERSKS